jgi:hypothetical protein
MHTYGYGMHTYSAHNILLIIAFVFALLYAVLAVAQWNRAAGIGVFPWWPLSWVFFVAAFLFLV